MKHPQAEAFLQFAKQGVATVARGLSAPLRAIEAIAAATTQDYDAGVATEQKIFGELMASLESKAMRHAFFGERAASKRSCWILKPMQTALQPAASAKRW